MRDDLSAFARQKDVNSPKIRSKTSTKQHTHTHTHHTHTHTHAIYKLLSLKLKIFDSIICFSPIPLLVIAEFLNHQKYLFRNPAPSASAESRWMGSEDHQGGGKSKSMRAIPWEVEKFDGKKVPLKQ